jgi:hypothetical protein
LTLAEDVGNESALGHGAMFELFYINQNCGNDPIVFKTDFPGNAAYPAVCFLIDFA